MLRTSGLKQAENLAEDAIRPPSCPLASCPSGSLGRIEVDGKFFARSGQKVRIDGVTYGPFAPDGGGDFLSSPDRVRADFASMQAAGINAVRTYHVPPAWFLDLADERALLVLIDVPWRKHVCFLGSKAARQESRSVVREAAQRGGRHSSVMAYSIGNEIPSDIIRWHGADRIRQFLSELRDVVKQADPQGLVTYASFPPTEYLDLSDLDFATYNVYLHEPAAFRRYLLRLQNRVGDKPLVLGELGMDSLRHGEPEQARHLGGHLREVRLMGIAGSFVFSWTDDWHTGGAQIEDWAFGVTRVNRIPKPAFDSVREIYDHSPVELLAATPKVSVVVCTYNGGRTLEQCLRSLLAMNYSKFEVIVVDDGSTDETGLILSRFPSVRAIRQANRGLSLARNVGLQAATGSIIAYTDSDCFADPDWLSHLVHQMQCTGAHAVGGPNLTPDDGWLAACVAASPGQPTHVLESDQVAEHIPGCNMAFQRDALESLNGFDTQFRTAGDDVDVCWRLQQAGFWITFAPGAIVWHHRRQGPRAYLRQQAGYGEAEALLHFKHPDKFNGSGEGIWRGVLYGNSLQGVTLDKSVIYHGTFARALFQTIYHPQVAHWVMLPSTLEWHLTAVLVALVAWPRPLTWVAAAVMEFLSIVVISLQARQARLAPQYAGFTGRGIIAVLCYFQPIVRSWRRYRTRWFAPRKTAAADLQPTETVNCMTFFGTRTISYWSENGLDRAQLLSGAVAELSTQAWGNVLDSGWSEFDLQIPANRWSIVQVCTAQEEHGGGKRLIRFRYRLRIHQPTRIFRLLGVGLLLILATIDIRLIMILAAGTGAILLGVWVHALRGATRIIGLFDQITRRLELLRLDGASDKFFHDRP